MEKETQQEKLDVYQLDPGSPYNYSVTTVTSDGTRSESVDLSKCTSMSIKVCILCLLSISDTYHFIILKPKLIYTICS